MLMLTLFFFWHTTDGFSLIFSSNTPLCTPLTKIDSPDQRRMNVKKKKNQRRSRVVVVVETGANSLPFRLIFFLHFYKKFIQCLIIVYLMLA
jgi:hypothetical protein